MSLDKIITVAPTNIRLRVGEIKQVQVITDYENFRVTMEPTGIVEWDNIHREFKGIKRGYVNIKFEALEINGENETVVGEDYIAIDVSEDSVKSPIRYMWHNRATNRLVTIQSDGNEDEDLIFKLPKNSGKLTTDTSIELFDSIIATPTITSPESGITDYDGLITSSDFKLKTVMATYPHTGTTWQYATDVNFKNILKEEYIHGTANNPLTQTSCSYYGISTYVRVKYHSNKSYSGWSEPILITWSVISPDDECSTLIQGTNDTTAYYGIVSEANVIDNRDYRGNYTTLIANNIKTFTAGQQVTHNNKLWYATTALTTTTSAKEPGTDTAVWTLDTREKLPTVRWLMDRVGIGLGNTDNNIDTYTSDGVKVGDLLHKDDNTWLKFIHKGKLIYTTAKPICTAISWCDVGKRNAVYGNRTVLIGSRLYRIRLLTEEEYTACFITIPATNENLNKTIELVDNNIIEDFREGPNRYVVSQVGTKTNIKAGSRTCAYRPVLELIRKGDEPYNKIPKCAEAEDEKFQYDPYTDTGYFGMVKDNNQDIISTEELMLYINWTLGSRLHVGTGYWKFYYHGVVKYVTKGILRTYTNAKFAIDKNINYIPDMGQGNKKDVIKDNSIYVISNINGLRIYPNLSTVYFEDSEISLFWRLTTGFNYRHTTDYQVGDNWESYDVNKLFGSSCEYHIQEVSPGDTSYMHHYIIWPTNINSAQGNVLDFDDGILFTLTVKTYETINEN